MKSNGRVGKFGEDLVCQYLIDNRHTILERNWRKGHFEVDIISKDELGIHFVEVKTRVAPFQASPESSVTAKKNRNIERAAMSYMKTLAESSEYEVFIDVATVICNNGVFEVDYFRNAYIPLY